MQESLLKNRKFRFIYEIKDYSFGGMVKNPGLGGFPTNPIFFEEQKEEKEPCKNCRIENCTATKYEDCKRIDLVGVAVKEIREQETKMPLDLRKEIDTRESIENSDTGEDEKIVRVKFKISRAENVSNIIDRALERIKY